MALTNMKVFNEQIQTATIETVAQSVDKFNAASGGAIVLTAQGITGNFRYENFWKSVHAAQRRVARGTANTNNGVSTTALTQNQEIGVKIAGGFGPILWEPGQLTWVQKNPAEAIEVISRNLAEAIIQDQLNTGIAAAVAAIESQNALTVKDTGTTTFSYNSINGGHALFGDASQTIITDVMNGLTFHKLIDLNLTNSQRLFDAGTVRVIDVLGRRIVVTDSPALQTGASTTSTRRAKVLSLTAGGVTVYDGSDVVTNVETTNGKQRIETTFQADYTFSVQLRGYAWDAGKTSPTNAMLETGGNWTRVATSIKHTAGVVTKYKYSAI
jgi:hypothetical protein